MNTASGLAFDTDCGAIKLLNDQVIDNTFTKANVGSLKLTVERHSPLRFGWEMITCKPIPYANHTVGLTLTFKQEELQKVALAFADIPPDARAAQDLYAGLLKEELGAPSSVLEDGQIVQYLYSWGDITAMYDPRNGSSAIHVTWKQ